MTRTWTHTRTYSLSFKVHKVVAILVVSCHLSSAAWQWPQDSGAGADRTANAKTLVLDGQPARGPARGPARQRYDIYEPDADDFTIPNDYRPTRPGGPGGVSLNRPFPPSGAYAPGAGYGAGGPGGFGGPGGAGYQPGGYGGQGAAGVTKCKCAYPGNCPAPALQFGSCDAGKTYCCTKIGRGLPGGRPVLAGPGGPIGIVKGQGGYGVSSGGLYAGGNPYGNGVGPYGGGYGGGSGGSGYGGGFGARGDVLYGPRPGGYNGGADFVPGPDFNRRPGQSLRPVNYNIYASNPYGGHYSHPYDNNLNGGQYNPYGNNPYGGGQYNHPHGNNPYVGQYNHLNGGNPYVGQYNHLNGANNPYDYRYDNLDTAPSTFGDYNANYAVFGSRPYDRYRPYDKYRPYSNLHGPSTGGYGLTTIS